MNVQFCDRCPVPPADDAEWAWRKERMAIRVAKIPDEPARDGGVNLEYVWLTNNQTYNLNFPKGYNLSDPEQRFQISQYMRDYVADHHLDGLFLDCPLDHVDLRACLEMVKALRDSMTQAILMPNFGSWDAWELTKDIPRWRAWAELREITDWHFVEVAIPVQHPAWSARMRGFLKTRDELYEKRVVCGVYDPGRKQEGLSAAIAHRISVPHQTYVMYHCAASTNFSGQKAWEYNWSDTLEALR